MAPSADSFSSKWIHVSEPIPHVFHVELNREPVNAFIKELWKEYGQIFDRISEEAEDARVIVLSSSNPKLFSAGIDLYYANEILSPVFPDSARGFFAHRAIIRDFQHAITAPERCRIPVIAAVHGPVYGLSLDTITSCDIRYAASSTTFCIKEVELGLAADVGTIAFLPKITGNHSLVRELAYTARPFTASEALSIGLLSKVVEGGKAEVVAAALDLAKVIASKSPIAVAGSKRLISHSRDHTAAENLEYTQIWNGATVQTSDLRNSIQDALTKTKKPTIFSPIKTILPKL